MCKTQLLTPLKKRRQRRRGVRGVWHKALVVGHNQTSRSPKGQHFCTGEHTRHQHAHKGDRQRALGEKLQKVADNRGKLRKSVDHNAPPTCLSRWAPRGP